MRWKRCGVKISAVTREPWPAFQAIVSSSLTYVLHISRAGNAPGLDSCIQEVCPAREKRHARCPRLVEALTIEGERPCCRPTAPRFRRIRPTHSISFAPDRYFRGQKSVSLEGDLGCCSGDNQEPNSPRNRREEPPHSTIYCFDR